MKLFADITGKATSIAEKYEQALAQRIEQLRAEGRSNKDILRIIQSEINSWDGFAREFNEQINVLVESTFTPYKLISSKDDIQKRVASERARLLRIRASEFSNYVPRISTIKAATKHAQKISYWSQASILLFLESDKREPDPTLRFQFYDGLFDTYTDALFKSKSYRATIWACSEFFTNKLYTLRCERSNFVDKIASRLSQSEMKAQPNPQQVEVVTPGWLDEPRAIVADLAHKADLIDWDAVRQADVCEEYRWELGPNFDHCPDCLKLAGEVRTRDEWYKIGYPGYGKTACRSKCQCQLKNIKELKL